MLPQNLCARILFIAKILASALALLASCVSLPSAGNAAVITLTLHQVVDSLGDKFSGSFDFDTILGMITFTNITATTSDGDDPVTSDAFAIGHPWWETWESVHHETVQFYFSQPFDFIGEIGGPRTDPIDLDNSFYINEQNPIISGYVAADAVLSSTPLPAALPLLATGLGALSLLGWRRNRFRGGVSVAT